MNISNWRVENPSEKQTKLVLFLISPFLSFLYSLKDLHTKSSYKVLFWFTLFFGLCMVFNQEVRNDGKFHAYEFQQYEMKDYAQYSKEVGSFFTLENREGTKDLFDKTVMYTVSRVTGNYHIYFLAIAFFYAFFMTRGLRIFTSEDTFDFSWASYFLLYIFFVYQFPSINGVRFGVAAWAAILCLFKLFRDGDKRYFLLALVTPLIHASFVFFLGMILIAYFTRRFEKAWFVLFILSFIFSEVSMRVFSENAAYLPGYMAEWADAYVHYDEWYATEGSGFYWLSALLKIARRFYFAFMIVLLYSNSNDIKSNPKTADIFAVLLVTFTIANFLSAIPSFSRFVNLAIPLLAYIWLVNFKGVKYNWVLLLFPFVSIVAIKENIDVYISLLEPCFLYSNPFYLFWKYGLNYEPITTDLLIH